MVDNFCADKIEWMEGPGLTLLHLFYNIDCDYFTSKYQYGPLPEES